MILAIACLMLALSPHAYGEPEPRIANLNDWNSKAAQRLWGCEECWPGDVTCSLGAAIAAKRNDNSRPCGFDEKMADYYGYSDIDESRAAVNPKYEYHDGIYDEKTDHESGIPDMSIVSESVESIQTDIEAYFVVESRWNFPPHWMNIHDPGPWDQTINWQEWVMPCADQSGVEYRCYFRRCLISVGVPQPGCGCTECPTCEFPDPGNPGETITCTCTYRWEVRPISDCQNAPPGSIYRYHEAVPRSEGELCCWTCNPINPATGGIAASYCGPGGASVDEDRNVNGTFFYKSDDVTNEAGLEYVGYLGYPHQKDASGIDLNDDLMIFDMSSGGWYYPGNHPAVLGDYDLVRDRYWKPNATSEEFKGSRPGYCAFEGYTNSFGSIMDCIEGGERDDFDRPASRQHNPCIACKGYDYVYDNTDDRKMCYNECFTYDLRYYRQFNIDSVWANIFKIVPEVHYPLTEDEFLPDTNPECIQKRPGKFMCNLKNIHEECDQHQDCIRGLLCTMSEHDIDEPLRCCPPDVEVRMGCCRDPKTQICIHVPLGCPPDQIIEYKYGTGEPGCESDDDCAVYKEIGRSEDVTTQHCSIGGATSAPGTCPQDIAESHCCPQGYEYDRTYRCCMDVSHAVRIVEMHKVADIMLSDSNPPETRDAQNCFQGCAKVAYCEQKIKETGKTCGLGEGGCRTLDRCGNRINECGGGLVCQQSVNSENVLDSACCLPHQQWNGRECIPYDNLHPWQATWTRSGGNPEGGDVIRQDGGGPIYIHAAGGGNIPDMTEAAGWGIGCPGGGNCYDPRFEEIPRPHFPDICTSARESCFYCNAGWPYRIPPSPIWFEARNFGADYNITNERYQVCNGPFRGIDGTLRAGRSWRTQTELECWSGNCNCGRAMRGIGDRVDGAKDGVGDECNTMQRTACKRGIQGTTPHKCNLQPQGHGTFSPSATQRMENGVPVDPNAVNASEIVPESCGRIQRKEVMNRDRYYSVGAGHTPENWFDYRITEIDSRGNESVTPYDDRGRIEYGNVLPSPPNPHTVLNTDILMHTLRQDTRELRVDVNYTIHHEIIRMPYVNQCMWIGCSRVEETVVSYTEQIWREVGCEKNWTLHNETTFPQDENSSAPHCCTNQAQPHRFPCISTYDTIECENSGGEMQDVSLRQAIKHDCDCSYFCWGCWHFDGVTDHYPITDNESNTVIERIADTSTVSAKTYGEHLTIENPINRPNSSSNISVEGMIFYGIPGAPAWSNAHFTIRSFDSKKGIDIFSAAMMEVEERISFKLKAKQFPKMHELTALQSTLALDFIIVQNEPETHDRIPNSGLEMPLNILNLTNECRLWDGSVISASDPLYLRWINNPVKKYYFFDDVFTGYKTRYSWEYPIILVDANNPQCMEYIYDKTYNIGNFRNYHEDEPRYYDYVGAYMAPLDIETGLEIVNWDASFLGNIEQERLKREKPLQNVHARYAPACDHHTLKDHSRIYDPPDKIIAPDMCSNISEIKLKVEPDGTRVWDCEYLPKYEWDYPISYELCVDARDWRISGLFRCEGVPSKYKSYCAEGIYHALWLDVFQFRYRWNDDNGTCDIQMMKECEPKAIQPNAYTLIFEPQSILTKNDWDDMEMSVYNILRSITFDPVGDSDPCSESAHTIRTGGLNLETEKIRPQDPAIVGTHLPGTGMMQLEFRSIDRCQDDTITYLPNDGPQTVRGIYAKFGFPYTKHTGFYRVGETIEVNVSSELDITANLMFFDDSGFTKSRTVFREIEVRTYRGALDYLCANFWIIIIAYAAVMAYRLFSGRALDLQDAWDEFKGKK